MPDVSWPEAYFIIAMMVLILVVSFAAVYFFVRQYRLEMKQREARRATKAERTAVKSPDKPPASERSS